MKEKQYLCGRDTYLPQENSLFPSQIIKHFSVNFHLFAQPLNTISCRIFSVLSFYLPR